eukprot:g1828.t1
MQKLSHLKNALLPKHQQRPYGRRAGWVLGFAVFIAGQVAIMSSLAFADQATCSVLSTLALISNAIFARCFFGEPFTRLDMLAMLNIIGGSFVIIMFFRHAKQDFSVVELEQDLADPAFLALGGALLGVLALCLRQHCTGARLSAFTYALTAAIIGGFSLTFGKVTMQLFKESAGGSEREGFGRAWTFVVVLLFALFAGSNIHFLNVGLASCPSSVLIPMYYNINNIITAALGIVAFKDYATFSEPVATVMFFAGMSLCMVGVKVLSLKQTDSTDESGGASAGAGVDAGEDEDKGEGARWHGARAQGMGGGGPASGHSDGGDGNIDSGTRASDRVEHSASRSPTRPAAAGLGRQVGLAVERGARGIADIAGQATKSATSVAKRVADEVGARARTNSDVRRYGPLSVEEKVGLV